MSVESTSTPSTQPTLRANTIGLPDVLFQSITTMALLCCLVQSGGGYSLCGWCSAARCAYQLDRLSLIALNIGSLARHLPSADGYYTYVSRGLGVQAGWMTGWLFSLTYLLIVPLQLLVLGPVMDSFVQQYFHVYLDSQKGVSYGYPSSRRHPAPCFLGQQPATAYPHPAW